MGEKISKYKRGVSQRILVREL